MFLNVGFRFIAYVHKNIGKSALSFNGACGSGQETTTTKFRHKAKQFIDTRRFGFRRVFDSWSACALSLFY